MWWDGNGERPRTLDIARWNIQLAPVDGLRVKLPIDQGSPSAVSRCTGEKLRLEPVDDDFCFDPPGDGDGDDSLAGVHEFAADNPACDCVAGFVGEAAAIEADAQGEGALRHCLGHG